jgi:hypothetical protein
MDAHRLAEERSLAYHEAVAVRLAVDPGVLERARARVHEWIAAGDAPTPHYAREWRAVLALSPESIRTFLVDRGERARELRQSTPFAGALPPRERWRIWREVADRMRRAA